MASRERRRPDAAEYSSLRWAVSIPAFLHEHQSCPLSVRIVDISTSGCRIWAGFRPTDGCPARLILSGIAPIRGRVAWTEGGAAAIRFDAGLHPAVLRHLVAGHPPDPDGPEWRVQDVVTSATAPAAP